LKLQAHIGKTKGSFKNKDNRTAKLLANWDVLRMTMESFIRQGRGVTLRARNAYGILLMMETGIRVGNEASAEGYVCDQKHHKDYGKEIQVYGLTTLRKEHTKLNNNNNITLNFLGKKAVPQFLKTSNPVLIKYYDTITQQSYTTWLGISYSDIYKFVKKSIGHKYKPKDIRTAAVNCLFLKKVDQIKLLKKVFLKKGDIGRAIKLVVNATAEEIGHTPGVCKSAYLSKSLQTVIKEQMVKKYKSAKAKAKAKAKTKAKAKK